MKLFHFPLALVIRIIVCCPVLLSAQNVNPPNTLAFLENEVATVRITMDSNDLVLLTSLDSLEANSEYPATFVYESNAYSDTVQNVGFRLRGNTSRFAKKKSFKVSFNSFTAGAKWLNLEKLNLNGEHNDPSILRSFLANHLLRSANLPAARTSYVRLYINNVYRGLYINVEHIDENFLKLRFPANNSGNLYKVLWGANLTNWGTSQAPYEAIYELKTNKTANDYSGLIHFINVLNNTPSASFACAIQQVFDVESYLKTLALEILMGHWDGYSYNQNNYYLYQRPSDGKFEFIEYDMDNTFGITWENINWTTRNIYTWSNTSQPRPLYTRLMSVPYFKDRLTHYVDSLANNLYTSVSLVTLLQTKQDLIKTAALADTYKAMDYGFTNNAFLTAITQAWGGHVVWSMANFISLRRASALTQLMPITTTNNPCSLGIEELTGTQAKIIRAFNALGQEIDPNTTNQLLFVQDENGTIQQYYKYE